MITPKTHRDTVLKHFHDIPSSAHLGIDKMTKKISKSFYWPGITQSVKLYCQRCDICAAHKLSKVSNKAPLGEYVVGEPMERVMMDILGPLPITSRGNRYILVISDWFTKWTECIALSDMETATVAQAFLDNFVSRFGVPLQVYTDQGRCFESKLKDDLCDLLRKDKTHSTSMRPQANGLVERFNRTLISMLKPYCSSQQTTWDIFLQQVVMAYRSSQHSSTKMTPNKMVFGREIILPIQAVTRRPKCSDGDVEYDEHVTTLQTKLQQIHEVARQNLKVAVSYQKKHYDITSKKRSFDTGQVVWIHDPTRKIGVCSKLTNVWKGPCLITRKLDDLVCMVKRTSSGRPKAYHIDRLQPYRGNKIPRWIAKAKTI